MIHKSSFLKISLIFSWLIYTSNFLTAQKISYLPTPAGDYSVSCISNIIISDSIFINSKESKIKGPSRFSFDLFYPGNYKSNQKRPYWINENLYREILDSIQFKLVQNGIQTNTNKFPTSFPSYKKFPLIVLSPGWKACRFEFTILVENLVSLGNIVAILDHPFIGYANDRGILIEPNDDIFKSYEEFKSYLGKGQSLIIDYLLKLNKNTRSLIYNRINQNKIVSIGQSTGFIASKGALTQNSKIKKLISLDADLGNENELDVVDRDILLMQLEQSKLTKNVKYKKNIIGLNYKNTGHFSVSDWGYLRNLPTKKDAKSYSNLIENYAVNINLFIKSNSVEIFSKRIAYYNDSIPTVAKVPTN